MTPEGRVKLDITKLLKKHGVYYFMPVQMGLGAAALDYLCCHCSRFFTVEAKAPGGKPTPRQNHTMISVQAAGGVTFVVDGPVGLRMLDEWLCTVEKVHGILNAGTRRK